MRKTVFSFAFVLVLLTPLLAACGQSNKEEKRQPIAVENLLQVTRLEEGWSSNGALELVAWSPNSKLLVMTGGFGAWLWGVDTFSKLNFEGSQIVQPRAESLSWSPDSKEVVVGTNSNVKIVRVSDYKTRIEIPAPPNAFVHWTTDGNHLFTWSGGRLQVWDAKTGQQLQSFSVSQLDKSAAFSPDETRVAVGGYGKVEIWDIATGKLVQESPPPPDSIDDHAAISLSWSLDGAQVVAGDSFNFVWIYDLAANVMTPRPVFLNPPSGAAKTYVAFSPDGSMLAVSCGDRAFIWDPHHDYATLATFMGERINSKMWNLGGPVAWAPDSTRIAIGNNSQISLWGIPAK